MLGRASPVRRDPLAQCGQKTSLAGKVKLFSAGRAHHVPALEGGMSGRTCLVCGSFLYLLVALVGRSWCLCASGWCPGRFRFFVCVFSVASEADRPKNRQVFGQVPPTAAKPVGCSPASRSWVSVGMFWDFGSPYHEVLRRPPRPLLRQRHTGSVRTLRPPTYRLLRQRHTGSVRTLRPPTYRLLWQRQEQLTAALILRDR